MGRLMTAVDFGVPAEGANGGDLEASLRCGNHAGTPAHKPMLWARLPEDVTYDQVVVDLHKSAARRI